VSIRIFRSPPRDFASDRLFALRLIPAASAEFRDRLEVRNKSIASDFPVIIHESRPRAWTDWQKESGIEFPRAAATIRLDSMIAVARAAERGLGAALVPSQLSDSWFDSGALVQLFPTQLITDDAFYFVCRRSDENSENVARLREWALSEFRGL
jgi:DNA-binding transcriptional LysR family regulator